MQGPIFRTPDLVDLVNQAWDQPVVRGLAFLVAAGLLVRMLSSWAQRRLVVQGQAHWGLVARMAINYGGGLLVLLIVARILEVDLTALLATAGVATLAIGFAAQTSLSNLIAGLFLLVDRPFKVGDFVELEGRQGIVEEISLLSTFVRTFDNIRVRWPNEVVLKATIVNLSAYPARRYDLTVTLAHGTDLVAAREVLMGAVSALPLALLEPLPMVVGRGLSDHGVLVEVRVWLETSSYVPGRTAIADAVHDSLRAAGIEIALPQLSVWTRGDPRPGR